MCKNGGIFPKYYMNIYSWFIYETLGSDMSKSCMTVSVITWTVMTDPSSVLMEAEQKACPPVHVFMYTCVSTAAMTTSSENFQPHLPIIGVAEISTHNARHSEWWWQSARLTRRGAREHSWLPGPRPRPRPLRAQLLQARKAAQVDSCHRPRHGDPEDTY